MKHYYYGENDKQFGPFTLDELKTWRIKKSTLVWAEGMEDWIAADQIDELKEYVISEPPPLPKKKPEELKEQNEGNNLFENDSNTIYDLSYKKETEAIQGGVFLIVLNIAFLLINKYGKLANINDSQDIYGILSILSFILRIGVTSSVAKIAQRQNRDQLQWGIFGFFLPSIALIVIGMQQKLKFKIKVDPSLSKIEQCNVLKEQAIFFAKNQRRNEAIQIYKYISKNYEKSNSDIFKLAELLYLNKQYGEAELLFLKIKDQKELSNRSNYYLGFISIKNKNIIAAKEYLKLDDKTDSSLFLLNTISQTSVDSLPIGELENKYGLITAIYSVENIEIIQGLENLDLGIWKSIRCSIQLYWNGIILTFSEKIRKGKEQSFFLNFYQLNSIERTEEDTLKFQLKEERQIVFSSKEYNLDSLWLLETEYLIAKNSFLN